MRSEDVGGRRIAVPTWWAEIPAPPCDRGCGERERCGRWRMACDAFRRYVACPGHAAGRVRRRPGDVPSQAMYDAVFREEDYGQGRPPAAEGAARFERQKATKRAAREARIAVVLAVLDAGGGLQEAADAAGVHPDTLRNWRRAGYLAYDLPKGPRATER